MAKVTVTGGSDDLIELKGAITEEFTATDDESLGYLAFSDGTVLSVEYDRHGIWRINRVVSGSAAFSKVEGSEADDTFDVATLDGDLRWVVCGSAFVRAEGKETRNG